MKPTDENGTNYLLVSTAAEKLGEQACTLGIKHINNGTLRLQFNREVACYARSIVNDVSEGKKSPEQGLKEIKDEQDSLFAQSWEVAKKRRWSSRRSNASRSGCGHLLWLCRYVVPRCRCANYGSWCK